MQVPAMGEIYSRAIEVLVWLGEPSTLEGAAKADVCIKHLNDAYQMIDDMYQKYIQVGRMVWNHSAGIR